ncbi:MAG TPA: GNAT family N-acetyltransferase [Chloroflexota bacterium]|nr:GNAT family N-acetyltransferase [Chloroflexota bacterium]HUM71038.1 GNAT family N-acetyltransferase [Chloroflexota bacterium]
MNQGITYRQGTVADSYAVFCVFEEALADLLRRHGHDEPTSWADPEKLAHLWQKRRPLYEHLAHTASHFWVAEQGGKSEADPRRIVAFARSIERDGTLELTEFFAVPGVQSGGVGRELLARAFPTGDYRQRIIIATTDMRAQSRYLKAGVYPRFPIYYFWRQPEMRPADDELHSEPMVASPELWATLAEIDTAVLGHSRTADHQWLLSDRQGMLYRRQGQIIGYGYMGPPNGPFALLDAADFPAVLAHAENTAAVNGRETVGFEVPMCNQTAVNYLLSRGYQIEQFIALFMSSQPPEKLQHYLLTSPPFFL